MTGASAAPDRGRDLSVFRIVNDPLSGSIETGL
jgi:hypothetical protein